MSDAEIQRIAREILHAIGRAPVDEPRFDVLSQTNELPPADEDRVIRALEAILRGG